MKVLHFLLQLMPTDKDSLPIFLGGVAGSVATEAVGNLETYNLVEHYAKLLLHFAIGVLTLYFMYRRHKREEEAEDNRHKWSR